MVLDTATSRIICKACVTGEGSLDTHFAYNSKILIIQMEDN